MTRPEILEAARVCVCGQREQDYGSPEDSFERIAALWNAYLGKDAVSTVDVAMMMALLKIARIKGKTATADSFVDLAGYAACGGEIATRGEAIERVSGNENRCLRCGEIIPEGRLICPICEANG